MYNRFGIFSVEFILKLSYYLLEEGMDEFLNQYFDL